LISMLCTEPPSLMLSAIAERLVTTPFTWGQAGTSEGFNTATDNQFSNRLTNLRSNGAVCVSDNPVKFSAIFSPLFPRREHLVR
jgi:hypothetical protein